MINKYGEPWPSKNTISASASTVDQFVSTKPVTITWQEYERARACVNACEGVAEMGSVMELVEVVKKYMSTPIFDGTRRRWDAEQELRAALAKFKLEADHD